MDLENINKQRAKEGLPKIIIVKKHSEVNLGIRAIASATFKDSASGGVVRVYHVTNNGSWNLIHDAIDVSELHYQFENGKGHRGDGRENLPRKYI